ncbi:MAG: tRNA 2-thiouridine(34) synthase MnmA [Propionibacteriaceae bacterium]|nr:tRNA 2-thiouridine(34) synthase MnmA [Propionibacteriaceae bacterium]
MKLVAAVSGGVDSAVTAARLCADGNEVTAVHLRLRDGAEPAAEDARRVADALALPFEVWDLRDAFQIQVLGNFAGEYAAGRTPNPCLVCNRTIKFGALLDKALARGFDGLATGHYARLARSGGLAELSRAVDSAKDQSYVLSVLTQAQLRHVWLPLGASTKDDVRAEASARGLPVAAKSESMDLCFIPDGDTTAWLSERLRERPGVIVDEAGTPLGSHSGTYRFTVGQRKGLNIKTPAPGREPRFVIGLDADQRRVIVGPRAHLLVTGLIGGPATWTSGAQPPGPLEALVQVRAHAAPQAGLVTPQADGTVEVILHTPIVGVAPGQTAAFYDGSTVLGSATIRRTVQDYAADTAL